MDQKKLFLAKNQHMRGFKIKWNVGTGLDEN